MVLVLSRFKVEEKWAEAVRRSFQDRPRLVEEAAGFLGMEVYTEEGDPCLFHLVTRWVDLESFEAWHRSEAHRRTIALMPKGMKLVSGFTASNRLVEIPEVAGIEEAVESDEPRKAAVEPEGYGSLLARHVRDSRSLHLVAASLDGTILEVNAAMSLSLGLPERELVGASLWGHLTNPDGARLRESAKGTAGEHKGLLNFVNRAQSPFSLECRWEVQADRLVLLGEPPREDAEAYRDEWLGMHNQLTVANRENLRRNKELEEARQELEKALAELRDTHWHLKKLQEVLPICMECGKVKTAGGWEGVVEYLKANALFLSHGYCPDCLAKVEKEWAAFLPPGTETP